VDRLSGPFGGDAGEVVGHDAPTDPLVEALFAVVETASEWMLAFEDADAPFDAGMEAATALELRLLFVLSAGVIFAPRFGQDDMLDAFGMRIGFVGG
jgi:hypothetical protein